MKKMHTRLLEGSPAYKKWHEHSHSSHYHWLAFGFLAVATSLLLSSAAVSVKIPNVTEAAVALSTSCKVVSTQQITTDPAPQFGPEISGNLIVYEDYRKSGSFNDDAEIYLYDLANKTERKISTSAGSKVAVDIDGTKIVWQDTRKGAGNSDVYYCNYVKGFCSEKSLVANTGNQFDPRVSGNLAVWSDEGATNKDVYLYDFSTNKRSQVTTNLWDETLPVVSGKRIAWVDKKSNDGGDIYSCVIGLTTPSKSSKVCSGQAVTASSSEETLASLSGDLITWSQRSPTGNYDIYVKDLASGKQLQVTKNSKNQLYSSIDGTLLAWEDDRNGATDIYFCNYNRKTNSCREQRLTRTSTTNDGGVSVQGNKIVWHDGRNGNWDIYMTEVFCPSNF